MSAPSATGSSLWLKPGGVSYARLAERIDALAAAHGTPRFEPHVTLLAGLPGGGEALQETARRLAQRLAPFEIRLGGLGHRDEYFRFLYLEVEPTPDLFGARAAALAAFGVAAGGGFHPHLSLVYAEPGRLDRDAIARDLAAPSGDVFAVDAVHLVRTTGPPGEWAPLAQFPLGS